MRLIDCNVALRKVEQIPFIANENKAFHEGCRYMQKKVLRIFHESKAIEAEPVRHGRWKGEGMGDYSCSLCTEFVSGNDYNYCPNCGAKMDKENP